jgi:hypothetical protein
VGGFRVVYTQDTDGHWRGQAVEDEDLDVEAQWRRVGRRVVALSHDSTTGWVELKLARPDGRIRTLSFTGGSGWTVPEGASESWESLLFERADWDPEALTERDEQAIKARVLTDGARVPVVRPEDLTSAMGLPPPMDVLHPPGSLIWNGRAIALFGVWVPIVALFSVGASKNGAAYGVFVGVLLLGGLVSLARWLGVDLWLVRRLPDRR